MKPFDPHAIPLAGQQLIEASAGTGKTYSIALLYLRLILERQLDVDEILVVTFTTSATEELRSRIRARLREMLDRLGGAGSWEGEETATGFPPESMDSGRQVRDRLADALTRMDEAAIYTIHGFCQRMLQDHAFDSGAPFVVEFLESEAALRQQIVEDYWRQRFYQATPEETGWALANWLGPEQLAGALQGMLSRPQAQCVPNLTAEQVDELRQRAAGAFQAVRESWLRCADEVREILTLDPGLKRGKDDYGPEPLAQILSEMELLAAGGSMPWVLPGRVDLLAATVMAEKLKKNKVMPEHPFFTIFDGFRQHHRAFIQGARVHTITEAQRYLRTELDRRKREQAKMYFDDLLTGLDQALAGRGGPGLRQRIRGRFKVALVDEFQDTDPTQYRIFNSLFGREPDPGLFMIGDPKQSIYSFRGADIFAYIRARLDTPPASSFTMDTNYRSTSAMVQAVNRLFGREASFVFTGDIDYHPVRSDGRADKQPLLVEGASPCPLQVQLLPVTGNAASGKDSIAKSRAEEAVARWTAIEIARLLNLGQRGQATIGSDSLAGGDIAVLVRTHREADLIQAALRRMQVSCVYYSRESVYATDEARQLYEVLAALLDLSDDAQVCNALVTDLFGITGDGLDGLRSDQAAWSKLLAELEVYHARWRNAGITAMFHALLLGRGTVRRLVALAGGDRKLTNFLHLVELLQEAAGRHGMDDLLRWFNHQIHHPEPDASSQQLRLESDENLVKIVTVHKAKGLEYPIVFLPFGWSVRLTDAKGIFSFHQTETLQLFVDIGSGDRENYLRAEKERLAEDLRLLYVAVTRARYCCYLSWGRINSMADSALAWLLHHNNDGTVPDLTDLTEERIEQDILRLNEEQDLVQLVTLPDAGGKPAAVAPPVQPAPAVRAFTGRIDTSWSIASFTRLAAMGAAAYTAGPGETGAGIPGSEEPLSVFTFPRGAAAGNFLHGMLESLDFVRISREDIEEMAIDRLRQTGFDPKWAPLVCRWIQQIAGTLLVEDTGLRLHQLPMEDRLTEMGFYFGMHDFDPAVFNGVLGDAGIDPLDNPPVELRGLMKGYIDLVFRFQGRFYIADYKSNHLGSGYQAYRQDNLEQAMRAHRYDLQYLIYSVALHRYLGKRMRRYDYTEHFGGVLYLFLRGMHPDEGPGAGVWYKQPPRELVERLDDCFGREERR